MATTVQQQQLEGRALFDSFLSAQRPFLDSLSASAFADAQQPQQPQRGPAAVLPAVAAAAVAPHARRGGGSNKRRAAAVAAEPNSSSSAAEGEDDEGDDEPEEEGKHDPVAKKKARRRLKNRVAAANSRERKKKYVQVRAQSGARAALHVVACGMVGACVMRSIARVRTYVRTYVLCTNVCVCLQDLEDQVEALAQQNRSLQEQIAALARSNQELRDRAGLQQPQLKQPQQLHQQQLPSSPLAAAAAGAEDMDSSLWSQQEEEEVEGPLAPLDNEFPSPAAARGAGWSSVCNSAVDAFSPQRSTRLAARRARRAVSWLHVLLLLWSRAAAAAAATSPSPVSSPVCFSTKPFCSTRAAAAAATPLASATWKSCPSGVAWQAAWRRRRRRRPLETGTLLPAPSWRLFSCEDEGGGGGGDRRWQAVSIAGAAAA